MVRLRLRREVPSHDPAGCRFAKNTRVSSDMTIDHVQGCSEICDTN